MSGIRILSVKKGRGECRKNGIGRKKWFREIDVKGGRKFRIVNREFDWRINSDEIRKDKSIVVIGRRNDRNVSDMVCRKMV